MFPDKRQQIEIELCGHRLVARWDPKHGRDRERSGVIAIGKTTLAALVQPGKQLKVTTRAGVICIG